MSEQFADNDPVSPSARMRAAVPAAVPRVHGRSRAPNKTAPTLLSATLRDWLPVLERLSVGLAQARALEVRALAVGVPFQAELLASGLVSQEALFTALAAELGLEFRHEVDPETLVMGERQCVAALGRGRGVEMAMLVEAGERLAFLIAPSRIGVDRMRRYLRRYPEAVQRLRVVAPETLREAVARRAEPFLTRNATDGLFETRPAHSARITVNGWQAAAVGAVAVALPFCLVLAWHATAAVVHAVATVFFLSCVALRLVVSAATGRERKRPLRAIEPAAMPVYTVLVALYQEADIVPDLLVALGAIVWPRSKLEIKLVCEADDEATLAAISAHELRANIEVVAVPPSSPRTKPKALSYVLPMTSGEFVVLYDAEDRPHPLQLVEAFQRFRDSGEDLACLQAPLSISNAGRSGIAALFALEYAGLFRGILPWLARRGLFLPLGGTSNHFRRAALDAVGAWDPCNVM